MVETLCIVQKFPSVQGRLMEFNHTHTKKKHFQLGHTRLSKSQENNLRTGLYIILELGSIFHEDKSEFYKLGWEKTKPNR